MLRECCVNAALNAAWMQRSRGCGLVAALLRGKVFDFMRACAMGGRPPPARRRQFCHEHCSDIARDVEGWHLRVCVGGGGKAAST